MIPATHYRHSNRLSLLWLPPALAVCGAIAFVAAFVYAYVMVYVPVVQLAFLLPLLFGAGMGAVIAFVLKKAKVRSPFIATGIAFLVTAGSYALSWIPWTYATFARADVPGLTFLDVLWPPSLVAMIAGIYETGAWSIGTGGGEAVSGVMLGVCWLMEALFVLGVVPFVAYGVAAGGVFCEKCERWCTYASDVMRLPVSAQRELAPRLDDRDLRVLTEVPRAQPYDNPFLVVDLAMCSGCGETNTLSLTHVHRTQQGNREQIARTRVVDHVLLTREQAEWVRRG
ncbi:hypothetical protein [Sandaracinus amylolyticus]|uniref:Uncharacterized protein n=1 Tax=Sandaracinus amylolyticus TaxID=927083 RepID=A0A0F6YKQ5_9BACT|nr:hypothetical protein [Sandaracinus amylolyticus]AKF09053.1 hypothetical protein DB32_006202 [Sandaracinus amylolyticus]